MRVFLLFILLSFQTFSQTSKETISILYEHASNTYESLLKEDVKEAIQLIGKKESSLYGHYVKFKISNDLRA